MNAPNRHVGFILSVAAFFLLLAQPADCQTTASLSNEYLRADFSGLQLAALVDLRTGFRVRFSGETFSLTLAKEKIAGRDLSGIPETDDEQKLSISYNHLHYKITVNYELRPGMRFLSKQIVVVPSIGQDYRVDEIETFSAGIEPAAREDLPVPPPPARTQGAWATLLRFSSKAPPEPAQGFGIFLLHQNPFNVWKRNGSNLSASYAPEMDWKPAYGPYQSDPFCIGLYPLSGNVFPATAIPEWTFVPDYTKYLAENQQIDMAEADALVSCVRSFLLYRPRQSVRVHVPWCENDYQIDVATPSGWDEFKRIIDRAAELGCQYVLFTPANSELSSLKENRDAWGWENLLFFAMGQKIRKGEWDPAKDPVPPSLQRALAYAGTRKVKLVSYSYPSLPFMQDPEWTRWAAGKVGGYNGPDMGLRSFQDWWVGKLVDFVRATGAGGYSFDHWWIAYDNASSRYAQWNGCRRILETLRRRLPDIFIDGRQQYMNFGPWTWLAGTYPHPSLTDEQPGSFVSFPDLHTDRVSANRQRFAAWVYRMQRFCPPEILPGFMTHQTERSDAKKVMRRDRFRPRDWDLLGWRFSVLSSIATAPFNHVVDYIPARDEDEFKALSEEDKRWFRGWLDWTDENMATLSHVQPIIGPPMIGRVDGTAACTGDHGFVFLFNPNYRQLSAEFALDATIGLEKGTQYILEELYPEKGMLIGHPQNGAWRMGDRVVLAMSGNQARVLQIRPLDAIAQPMLFNVRGKATLSGARIALSYVDGEIGSGRDIVIRYPGKSKSKIESVTANGSPVPFQQTGNGITAHIEFAGDAFAQSRPLWTYDPAFAGGTVRASFRIPRRIVEQLRARRQSWPVPYTDDDLIATWLGSHRLLLYAHVAEPDDAKDLGMTIDGKPAEVRKAYNNIYGNRKSNFLGWYADISALEAEKEHILEVVVPPMAAGRFQGLFFENIEPEFTQSIAKK
jgi:hypothetical protein